MGSISTVLSQIREEFSHEVRSLYHLRPRHPATGAPVAVEELSRYARDKLRVNYIFWGTQEPHYSEAIIPYLENLVRNEVH